MTTVARLETELRELRARIDAMIDDAQDTKPVDVWPIEKDRFWMVNYDCTTEEYTYDSSQFCANVLKVGNCYKTQAEAEASAVIIRRVHKRYVPRGGEMVYCALFEKLNSITKVYPVTNDGSFTALIDAGHAFPNTSQGRKAAEQLASELNQESK